MSNSKLSEGISILYDMEQNNYLMSCGIEKMNREISKLGKSQTFSKPREEWNDFSIWTTALAFMSGGGIGGAILGAILGFFDESGFFLRIISLIGGTVTIGLIGGAVGFCLGLIIGIILKIRKHRIIKSNYTKACQVYEKNIAHDSIRVKQELIEKKILISMRDELIDRRREATQKLQSFYSTMGIDGNYRNLIPIGYMHEFMRLGISDKLEGPDGLYYLVMQELRHDQLHATMEEISTKLDTLIDNQHRIYDELRSIDYKCNNMVQLSIQSARTAAKNNRLLSDISDNTSIAAYNSQRISQELAFQNFMMLYR